MVYLKACVWKQVFFSVNCTQIRSPIWIIWHTLMSSYVILCHLMSSYVILCHLMSSYVILCHLMSSQISTYVIFCHLKFLWFRDLVFRVQDPPIWCAVSTGNETCPLPRILLSAPKVLLKTCKRMLRSLELSNDEPAMIPSGKHRKTIGKP